MKKLIKTITIMLVMFLVTMSVDSIDTRGLRVAFANDDSTGYKIDVNYDENNEANLIGNFENINSEITLTSLIDEDGNIYDPYNFLLHVTENKTYKFELLYKDKEEQKELSEHIEVIVDKGNLDTNTEDKSEISDDDEKSFIINDTPVYKLKTEVQKDKLSAIIYLDKSSASEMNTIYSITDDQGNNYDIKSDKWIINKNGDYTFEIKYRDNTTGMDMIDKISIKISKLEERKSMPVSELKKKMLLQSRATQSDKFQLQAYTSESNYKLDKTVEFNGGLFADYKKELDAAVEGRNFKEAKVLIGGENGNYYNITALYKYKENNQFKEYYILESQGNSQVELAYELSSTDEVRLFYETISTSTYKINNPTQKDWIVKVNPKDTNNIRAGSLVIVEFSYPSMYLDANIKVKSNSGDIKTTELSNSKAKRTKIISFEMPNNHVSFDYSNVSTGENWRRVGVYNENSTYFNSGEMGHTSIESSSVNNGTLIYKVVKNNLGSKATAEMSGGISNDMQVSNKDRDGNAGKITIPVSAYTKGNTLTFTYESFRGVPKEYASISPSYYYYPQPAFIIDYFPGNSSENNFKSENYVRNYFRTSNGNGSFGNNTAVTKTFENGMKVTSKSTFREEQAYPGVTGKFKTLLKIVIEITIENAYDDFRILTNATSGANAVYSIENTEGLSENSYIKIKDDKELPIYTGFSFNGNDKPAGDFTFYLIPKDGYSVPDYKLYDETGRDITNNRFTPVNNEFPNNKGEYVLKFSMLNYGHESHRPAFISKLIKYKYSFSNINKNDSELNVENKRFFAVPQDIPSVQNGQYFNGWQLDIIMGDGSKKQITNSGRKNGLFYADDLVDILDVYKQSQKYMTTKDVGKENYELNFKPVIGGIKDGSLVDINVSYQIQDSLSVYRQIESKNLKGVYGETVNIGNYNEKLDESGNTYILNKNKSTFGNKITSDNFTIGTLKYDKVIKVLYNSGIGSAIDPVDDGEYTITNGNSSVINVSDKTLTNGNATFEGWVIKGDTTDKIYHPNTPIDLSTLDINLRQSIFDEGQIVLEAKWKSTYGPVKSDSNLGDYIDEEKNQVIFENEDFTIEAIFKWENAATSWDKLNIALYKQEPNAQSFNLWASNENGQGQNNSNVSWSYEDLKNGTIKVSATIKNGNGNSIDKNSYDNAKYRIIAWNDKNGTFTADTVNDQVGLNTVPSVTTTITVLSNIDIIKYPAEIKLFDQTDGSIQSSEQMVTLDSKYSSQNWSNNFDISVEKETVEMSNSKRSTFEANIFNSNDIKLTSTNKVLGTLNYIDSSKQSLTFTIKKDDGIKNANGDIYTGTMKFVVKKVVTP